MEKDQEVRKIVTRLFKGFLVILEDLQEEHRAVYTRLLNNSPEDLQNLIAQADYFDDRKMEWLRKRVLDMGNDAVRETERVEIEFKFKKDN